MDYGQGYECYKTTNPNGRETFPLEMRAAQIHIDYLKSPCDIDQKYHDTQPGEVRPIEAKLLEFGARNGLNLHADVDFVLGPV